MTPAIENHPKSFGSLCEVKEQSYPTKASSNVVPFKTQPQTFDDVYHKIGLTDDVWLEVMKYLAPEQVIALRQVNKRIYRLSHEPSVWVYLRRRLQSIAVIPNDGPPGSSTHEETVVRCVKIQQRWAGHHSFVPRTRRLDYHGSDGPGLIEAAIVIGNRPWLFTINNEGGFSLWDLKKDKPLPVLLGSHPRLTSTAFGCELVSYHVPETDRVIIVTNLTRRASGFTRQLDFFQVLLDAQELTDLGTLVTCREIGDMKIYGSKLLYGTTWSYPGYAEVLDWQQALSAPTFEFWGSIGYDVNDKLDVDLLSSPSAIIARSGGQLFVHENLNFDPMMTTHELEHEKIRRSSNHPTRVISLLGLGYPSPGSKLVATYYCTKTYIRLFRAPCGRFGATVKKHKELSPVMKAVNGLHRSVLVTRAVNRFTDDSTFIHFVTNSRLSAPEALADCLDLAPQPVFYTPDIPRWTAWKMDFSEGTGTVCLVDEGKLFVIDFDV